MFENLSDYELAVALQQANLDRDAIEKHRSAVLEEIKTRHPGLLTGESTERFKVLLRNTAVVDQDKVWKFLQKNWEFHTFFKATAVLKDLEKLPGAKGLYDVSTSLTIKPVV